MNCVVIFTRDAKHVNALQRSMLQIAPMLSVADSSFEKLTVEQRIAIAEYNSNRYCNSSRNHCQRARDNSDVFNISTDTVITIKKREGSSRVK